MSVGNRLLDLEWLLNNLMPLWVRYGLKLSEGKSTEFSEIRDVPAPLQSRTYISLERISMVGQSASSKPMIYQ